MHPLAETVMRRQEQAEEDKLHLRLTELDAAPTMLDVSLVGHACTSPETARSREILTRRGFN